MKILEVRKIQECLVCNLKENCANNIWEVLSMATKSILKDVSIKEQRLAHTFVKALENAENTRYEQVQIKNECKELTGDKIKEFFEFFDKQ